MEKILESIVDEVAKRVLAKMGEDTTKMQEFFKVKIKACDVEGLDELIEGKLDSIKSECMEAAEDAAQAALNNAEIEVSIRA